MLLIFFWGKDIIYSLVFHSTGTVMLGNDFEVVPGGFAFSLKTLHVLFQLVKINFRSPGDSTNLKRYFLVN